MASLANAFFGVRQSLREIAESDSFVDPLCHGLCRASLHLSLLRQGAELARATSRETWMTYCRGESGLAQFWSKS